MASGSGPYLPPHQGAWRPGYLVTGGKKKGRRGSEVVAAAASDDDVTYAKAREEFFADGDPSRGGAQQHQPHQSSAQGDGTGSSTDYDKLRDTFWCVGGAKSPEHAS